MGRINKKRVDLAGLNKLMKDLDRKISIKVGIIGEEATQKHEGSNLTNAELGAVHEFGATINVTDKMKGWFWHTQGIHKSNEPIEIPARSFLRGSLLTPEGKKELSKAVTYKFGKSSVKDFTAEEANKKLDNVVHIIAELAYLRVLKAFDTEGYGEWQPTSEYSKQLRKYNKNARTLTDSGQLQKSISYSVNGKQWGKPPYGNTK